MKSLSCKASAERGKTKPRLPPSATCAALKPASSASPLSQEREDRTREALEAPEAFVVEDEALKEDEPSCSVGNLFSPWRCDPPSWDIGPHPRMENQPAVDAAEAAGGGDSAGPPP